ncbi:DUF3861 domain-containing protein [Pasteurellaceae bacterium LIM206]|nr:DUF3861 domain-containing protein [Pasteurellaceae bacterium LIM206]
MKQHQYQLTLTHVADINGNPVEPKSLTVNTPNHDDIFNIIEIMKNRPEMTEEMAQRFVIGLKTMSEVMLENRKNPLFEQLIPHFRAMMEIIKAK